MAGIRRSPLSWPSRQCIAGRRRFRAIGLAQNAEAGSVAVDARVPMRRIDESRKGAPACAYCVNRTEEETTRSPIALNADFSSFVFND